MSEESQSIWVVHLTHQDDAVYMRQVVYPHHLGIVVHSSWRAQAYYEHCIRAQIVPDFSHIPPEFQAFELYHVLYSRMLLDTISLDEQSVSDGDVFVLTNLEKEITAGLARQMGVPPAIHPNDFPFENKVSTTRLREREKEKRQQMPLAVELAALLIAMRREASTSSHRDAISEIAAAELAAMQADNASVLKYLKLAGAWALDVATKIGVNLVSEALKQPMGK
jgi:hypothetical protein